MTQQVINVGAAPNDGTGDPLRTAYIKTNDNFTELYSRAQTSPPTSLIGQLGDLAGMYAYDQNYFYYCYQDFDGSSIIWNEVAQIGNVSVTQIASGNSSVAVTDINGDVSVSVDGVSNVVVVNSNSATVTGDVSVTGNIDSGNIDSGSIRAVGLISATGTITGNFFVGNGSALTGITTDYNNSNVASYLPTYTGSFPLLNGAVSTSGNVTGAYILGNGSQLTGMASYTNSNVATFLNGSVGNIIPAANVTYSLGSPTRQWKDIYVSNATIYMNSVPITVGAGNVLSVGGQPVLTNGSASSVSTTGNVSGGNVIAAGNIAGNYVLGNGAFLTGVASSYGNADVAAYLPTYTGNLAGGNVLQNGVRVVKFTTANTAPTNPVSGDQWWYQAGNVMYQYINDGSSSQWVDTSEPDFPPSSTSAGANTIAQRDINGSLTANVFIGSGALLTDLPAGPSGPTGPTGPTGATGLTGATGTVATVSSANVTYTAPYTSSVQRTGQSKYSDVISVKDFGAVGNDSNDDTAEIQAAIDAAASRGGGTVYFPSGTYKISGELAISGGAIKLLGENRYSTTIKQYTTNAKCVNISGFFSNISSLGFSYNGTPTSGGTAIYITSSYVTLNDFVINNAYIGVYFYGSGAVAGKATQFEIFDYETVGLQCEALNDVFISQFIMNAGNTSRGTLGGIRLYGKVEAFVATDGDILLGAYSLTTDTASNTVGNRPAYNNFTNVYFDSSVNGALSDKMVETEFVGCWFSSGRSGSGQPGMQIYNSSSIGFTNCRFFNCGSSGAYVDSTSVRTVFTACKFESNSQTTGSGVSPGLSIANNTQHVQVLGCVASNTLYNGLQSYGVVIGTGCDYFNISNNDFTNNITGGVSNGSSTGATKVVASNFG